MIVDLTITKDEQKSTRELLELVHSYFVLRKYVMPNPDEALMFLVSEIGELADAMVHARKNWVRNNPGEKDGSKEAIANEIGDVLMMLTALGITFGLDPLECMLDKFESKGWKP